MAQYSWVLAEFAAHPAMPAPIPDDLPMHAQNCFEDRFHVERAHRMILEAVGARLAPVAS